MPHSEAKETQTSALNKWSKFQSQNTLTPNSSPSSQKTLVASVGRNHGRQIWHRPVSAGFPDYLVLRVIKISYGQIFIKPSIYILSNNLGYRQGLQGRSKGTRSACSVHSRGKLCFLFKACLHSSAQLPFLLRGAGKNSLLLEFPFTYHNLPISLAKLKAAADLVICSFCVCS